MWSKGFLQDVVLCSDLYTRFPDICGCLLDSVLDHSPPSPINYRQIETFVCHDGTDEDHLLSIASAETSCMY